MDCNKPVSLTQPVLPPHPFSHFPFVNIPTPGDPPPSWQTAGVQKSSLNNCFYCREGIIPRTPSKRPEERKQSPTVPTTVSFCPSERWNRRTIAQGPKVMVYKIPVKFSIWCSAGSFLTFRCFSMHSLGIKSLIPTWIILTVFLWQTQMSIDSNWLHKLYYIP